MLEKFCMVVALAVSVLGILFLFDFTQSHWVLNFTLGLGVLLHVALALLWFLQHRQVMSVCAVLLAFVCAGTLVYFNFM